MLKVLLVIGIVYTLIRFISLKKQLRKIEKQIYSKERVNITLNDKDVERLAETINTTMQVQKQLRIDIMNREERLKQNISDIAHDLRTPLASIRGYITLLKNCTEQEKKEYLNIIERKSEELNLLINNFYEVSLYDNSSLEIQTTSIDIVQIIMEIVISNYSLIKNNEIETDGLFILRDSISPGQLVPGLELDKNHVQVDRKMATNLKGCFAAGDIVGIPYQYIKAAGEGNIAALSAVSYLDELKRNSK